MDYKSKPKVIFYDETTKEISPYQFQQWIDSPHIVDMINRGANLKIATQDFEEEPPKYSDGRKRKVIFYFSALKNQPAKPIDGLKPIGQTMPQYKEVPMTQAQPSHQNTQSLLRICQIWTMRYHFKYEKKNLLARLNN